MDPAWMRESKQANKQTTTKTKTVECCPRSHSTQHNDRCYRVLDTIAYCGVLSVVHDHTPHNTMIAVTVCWPRLLAVECRVLSKTTLHTTRSSLSQCAGHRWAIRLSCCGALSVVHGHASSSRMATTPCLIGTVGTSPFA